MRPLLPILTIGVQQCLENGFWWEHRYGRVELISKEERPSADPSTYRPITLLNAFVRLVMKVLDTKMRKWLEDNDKSIPLEQGAFVPARNTHLQVLTLLLLRDFARVRKKGLFIVFLDIRKAFDTMDHQQLLQIMGELGIPDAFVAAVHRFLIDFKVEVMGHMVPVERGAFQGGPISPLLCALFLWDLIKYMEDPSHPAFHGVPLPWDPKVL